MRHLILIIGFMAILAIQSPLQAQNTDFRNAVSLKFLMLDFDSPILDKALSFSNLNYGVELGYFRNLNTYFNIGLPLRYASVRFPLSETIIGVEKNTFLSFDAVLQAGYFNASSFLQPYVFSGIGGFQHTDADGSTFGAHVPLGLGFDLKLTSNIYFEMQSEYQIAFVDNRSDWTHSVGLKFLFGSKGPKPVEVSDLDGDGIPDSEDDCPTLMGSAATRGCPDTDEDGLADRIDRCPNEAGVKALDGCPDSDSDGIADPDDDCPEQSGPADNKGCPYQDSDGDGIFDHLDNCPNEVGTADNNGCPDRDSDGDGLTDGQDNCPNQAGPPANGGCPLPDADGDGVPDVDDRCPNTPGLTSNNGCPEISPADKTVLLEAAQALEFETSRATLKTASLLILDNIADIMRRYPAYHLTISGHTDSVGSAAKNKILSERRAKSCSDYLALKGISASRMNYVGYGETQPIADNRYKDGRQKNRRVEFNMYIK
ncbi:MAG: OmpA family protein [Bacteroidota bacterium]